MIKCTQHWDRKLHFLACVAPSWLFSGALALDLRDTVPRALGCRAARCTIAQRLLATTATTP